MIGKHDGPELLDARHAFWHSTIAGSFSLGQPIAKAGLNLALWDLFGKPREQPLPKLWQRPTRDTVELSWTLDPSADAETALPTLHEQVAAAEQKLARYQQRNAVARRSHTTKTIQALHNKGIWLKDLPRCQWVPY